MDNAVSNHFLVSSYWEVGDFVATTSLTILESIIFGLRSSVQLVTHSEDRDTNASASSAAVLRDGYSGVHDYIHLIGPLFRAPSSVLNYHFFITQF